MLPGRPKSKSVKLSFQEKPDRELSLTAYAFDRAGNLVNTAPVADTIDREKLGGERVLLAPALPKGGRATPTIESLRRINALEVPSGVESLPISVDIIKSWIICLCFITGRVVRTINGIDYPVCHARVHACEVDKWPWFIWKLSDIYIKAIRNDLLGREPIVVPPIVTRPPLGDPPPIKLEHADHAMAASAKRVTMADAIQPVTADAATAFRKAADNLPAEVKAGLASESLLTVRQTLVDSFVYLKPLIYYWPWFWYSCDDIGTDETDDDGRFSFLTFYNCPGGDRPDVHFSVEFFLGGAWQTVYNPPKSTGTYWNYPCGTEVTIHITDERVPICPPVHPYPGKKVIVTTIGNNVNVARIQRAAAGTSHGLTEFEPALGTGRPFGGVLEIHTDFGLAMQHATNAVPPLFFYRWSYRRLGSTGTFTILDTPVSRRYRVEPASGNPEYRTLPLGPVSGMPTTMFMVPPKDPFDPDGPAQWSVQNPHLDTPVAFFNTTAVGDPNPVTAAGKYELLLELFDSTGAPITDWTAAGVNIEGFIPDATVPAPFGLGVIPTTRVTPPGGDSEFYQVPPGWSSAGMRLVVHVDNNPVEAVISPVSSTGFTSSDDNCGFYIYPGDGTGTLVRVPFKARHQNNFALFSFQTYRGSGNLVPTATASGRVGFAANGFVPDAGSNYQKMISVHTLLTDTVLPPPATCTKAAFSETLHVVGMATNGWPGTLYEAYGIPHAYALSNT